MRQERDSAPAATPAPIVVAEVEHYAGCVIGVIGNAGRPEVGPPMSTDAFSEFERIGWERAAPSYEECWTDTELFVEPLLDAAHVHAGSRLLDVACGPGFVSEAAAARGVEPIGLDVAAGMVERARRRCPGLQFVEGDAQRLPFPDACFDAGTMNFGILHVSQPETALREARRVLRPGGWFAFTVWVAEGHAADEIVDAAITAYAVPVELPEGPPVYRFADLDESRRVLGEMGFDLDSLRADTVTAIWRIPTAELLFEAHMRAGVRVAGVLHAQPPELLEAIREAIVEGVRRYADDDEFALPIVARVISARVGAQLA
jgi:ubiquinone/menaquinone biosynthesis C-methylase UbiE